MPDEDDRTPDEGPIKNAQDGGRYGKAAHDEPHLAPEVAPVGVEDADLADPPLSFGGALPENRGVKEPEREDEE